MVFAFLASGCTLREHRLQPYRDDSSAAAALEQKAVLRCWLRRGLELPPAGFRTDGCSISPNGAWAGCCVDHDIEYWCGGSAADRLEADRVLRACVAEHSSLAASLGFAAVRVGGVGWTPFHFRWGYGWEDE